MEQNARIRLKEYTDAQRLPLPKYTVTKCGSEHNPIFNAVVCIRIQGQCMQFYGDSRSTKKDAHESAAENAFHRLTSGKIDHIIDTTNTITTTKTTNTNNNTPKQSSCRSSIVKQKKIVLLIDYENRPQFFNKMSQKQIDTMDIYIFLYKNHALMDKPLPREKAKIITTDSAHINGSDCCIQMYTSILLMENKYEKYIIATEDKFANALTDHIQSDNHPWRSVEAQIVRNPTQMSF
jgi:hypothetical protein